MGTPIAHLIIEAIISIERSFGLDCQINWHGLDKFHSSLPWLPVFKLGVPKLLTLVPSVVDNLRRRSPAQALNIGMTNLKRIVHFESAKYFMRRVKECRVKNHSIWIG
ncbi:MAG: hypothetical protein WBZ36_15610 [Candidatus Nitrosopolaris sp.]